MIENHERGSAGWVALLILLGIAILGTAMPQLGIPIVRELGCQIRGGQYVEFFGERGCIGSSDL